MKLSGVVMVISTWDSLNEGVVKRDALFYIYGMSISKAQAAALAEGFLDDLGSSKDDFAPRNTLTELFLLAGELIEDAQNNLNASNRNASGELSESLVADEPTQIGATVSIDILMNFYGAFVNKGVKGTRSGRSTAGYSFRNEGVSKNMLKALAEWVKRGKQSTRTVTKYKGYGRHERKNKTISQYDKVYALGRAIKQHGLKPTGFLDKAVQSAEEKFADRLGAALRIDVIDGLREP